MHPCFRAWIQSRVQSKKTEGAMKKPKQEQIQRLEEELSNARELLCLHYRLGMFCFAKRTEKLIARMEEELKKLKQ